MSLKKKNQVATSTGQTMIITDHGTYDNFEEFVEFLESNPYKALETLSNSKWNSREWDRLGSKKNLRKTQNPILLAHRSGPLSAKKYFGREDKQLYLLCPDENQTDNINIFDIKELRKCVQENAMKPKKYKRVNHFLLTQTKSGYTFSGDNIKKEVYPSKKCSVVAFDKFEEIIHPLKQKQTGSAKAIKLCESKSHIDLCLIAREKSQEILAALKLSPRKYNVFIEREFRLMTNDRPDIVYQLDNGKGFVILEAEPLGNNIKDSILKQECGLYQLSKYRALIAAERLRTQSAQSISTVLIIPKCKLDEKIIDLAAQLGHRILQWDFKNKCLS